MSALTLRPVRALRELWQRPNPVWVREMRQSARLTRTPLILALVTIVTALVITTVGGVGASNTDPATVGTIIFHTFFSLAYAIVSWVGPGVAALTIASERSGRTWETVLLTRMSAREVARGKFASAFTYVALYVVMLAPVGALAFLFGGVSATEVMLAFVFLFVLCALSVGFGLSVSSAVANPTVAMLVTVPIAAVVSLAAYLGLGVALSVAVHRVWPGVVEGAPVWLPTAYSRAELGWHYLAFLVFAPLSLAAVVSTFFHEVTAANIAQANDDRSSGLRRWFLFSAPVVAANALLPRLFQSDRTEMWEGSVFAIGVSQVFLVGVLLLFAGEPLTPSARVQRLLGNGSRLRRFLGPGIEPALLLLLLLGAVLLSGLTAFGATHEYWNRAVSGTVELGRVVCVLSFGGYALCFLLFLTGFVLLLRARSPSGTAPRAWLLGVILIANVCPWILLAMAGLMGRIDEILWLASPAPSFVFQLFDALLSKRDDAQTLLFSMVGSATAWALAGVACWTFGSRALRQRLERERLERERLYSSAPAKA